MQAFQEAVERGGDAVAAGVCDPPYPGRAKRYYAEHPDYDGEVDHVALIEHLSDAYDGWALSTSADALHALLPVCPDGTSVAAWHRGERPNRAAARPLNAWEPVIYHGGRNAAVDPSFSAARDATPPPAVVAWILSCTR